MSTAFFPVVSGYLSFVKSFYKQRWKDEKPPCFNEHKTKFRRPSDTTNEYSILVTKNDVYGVNKIV